jgi:N-terminal domain of anti-restriction factor ArdC
VRKADTSNRPSIYQTVTDRIISSLKAGVIPWEKPWNTPRFTGGPFPRNFYTGKPYRGINILLLWSSDFSSPFWLTFKQAQELKGNVRKGECGTPIVFFKQLPHAAKDDTKTDEDERSPFVLCHYTVFNVEQCDGAPCRREEGVVRDDPGKPKLSCVHQSHRMPKGLWDQSMTGARPKSAQSSQRRRVRARLVWLRLNCLNSNPCDLSADSRTPMTQVRIPSEACSVHRLCTHSVYSAQTPVRGLRMSWGPKRVASPLPRKHGMAYSRTMKFAPCMATESEYYPNARRNGRDRCETNRIRVKEEARQRENLATRGKSDSLVALTARCWVN